MPGQAMPVGAFAVPERERGGSMRAYRTPVRQRSADVGMAPRYLNASASIPLIHGPLGCAWSSVNRGRRRSPQTLRPFVSSAAAARASALGDCWATGATATCACKLPRIGPPASTSMTLVTAAMQARWPMPPAARAVSDAERPEIGDLQGRSDLSRETSRCRKRGCGTVAPHAPTRTATECGTLGLEGGGE